MRRREFITLVGGAAVFRPLAARAQQGERTRRVGVLEGIPEDPYLAAFLQRLQQLGWVDGRNVQIDTRWGAGKVDAIRKYAAELSGLAPDVMLAVGTPAVGPLLQATNTAPIVFLRVTDPVGAGFVDSLARPAAMLLDFPCPNTASAGNGWNCSRRSRQV